MKHYTFYRENNKFDDILKDPAIKKLIYTKIHWNQYLRIGLYDIDDKLESYITLKYGDDIKPADIKDFTPVPGVDYVPKKDKTKFKKSIR